MINNNNLNFLDILGLVPWDKWYGHNEKDFQRWVHDEKSKDGREPTENYTKKQVDDFKKEWLEKKKGKKKKNDDDDDDDDDDDVDPDASPDTCPVDPAEMERLIKELRENMKKAAAAADAAAAAALAAEVLGALLAADEALLLL